MIDRPAHRLLEIKTRGIWMIDPDVRSVSASGIVSRHERHIIYHYPWVFRIPRVGVKRLRSRRLRTPLFLEPILLVISVDGESCQWSGDFTHHFRWAMPHICSWPVKSPFLQPSYISVEWEIDVGNDSILLPSSFLWLTYHTWRVSHVGISPRQFLSNSSCVLCMFVLPAALRLSPKLFVTPQLP